MAPVVVRSCDDDDRQVTTTTDGRPRVVICPTDMRQIASSNLRFARESIAHNQQMSEEVRAEVLRDLDAEIERIERGDD
jgi:bla regulator protein blaR1